MHDEEISSLERAAAGAVLLPDRLRAGGGRAGGHHHQRGYPDGSGGPHCGLRAVHFATERQKRLYLYHQRRDRGGGAAGWTGEGTQAGNLHPDHRKQGRPYGHQGTGRDCGAAGQKCEGPAGSGDPLRGADGADHRFAKPGRRDPAGRDLRKPQARGGRGG